MSEIAIVGIDCRFPGAPNPGALWNLLMQAEDGIGEVPGNRWLLEEFHSRSREAGRQITSSGGFIADPDAFDAEFFGISPREAEAMDPQQRLALQTVWRALEDATLDPRELAGSRTGVFVGVMGNEWAHLHMLDYESIVPQTMTGNGYCMIPNRISYQLDLKGPSLAIDTACSSSLVATQLACAALRADECDQAIVAGVNLILTPSLGIFYSQAGLSSEDGRCRPFSVGARGIGRSEGVGAVVLCRLDSALADSLPIYAVIKGGAINHDGRSNGITAPNRHSQREVIQEAYRRSGVRAEDISFVEAHGTGTILGDHIEVNALADVHAVPRKRPCAVGSIKGNLSHLEGAAGIAGLIKVALALHHGVVPASRYATSENPQLGLSQKGWRLLKAPEKLGGKNVLAAVSSFGLGGTNAHLVLTSAPVGQVDDFQAEPGILTVSAPTRDGLKRSVALIVEDLASQSPRSLGQFCWTSNRVKSSGHYRLAVVARNQRQVLDELRSALTEPSTFTALTGVGIGQMQSGWLFAGQGSEYAGMSRLLYENCSAYRAALERVDACFARHLGCSVIELMFNDEMSATPAHAHAGLFAVEFGLGQVLIDAGLRPAWMIGYGEGEFAAAALAGVFTLEDACYLVVKRGLLIGKLRDGAMPAAGCAPEGINGSNIEEFSRAAAEITYHPATIPIFSTVLGRQVGKDEPMNAAYWSDQIRQPGQFERAFKAACTDSTTHLIELGPKPVLALLARSMFPQSKAICLSICSGPEENGYGLLQSVAKLYCNGAQIRWDALYSKAQRARRRLSPYEFSTDTRFWLSAEKHLSEARNAPGRGEALIASPPASDVNHAGGLPVVVRHDGGLDELTSEVIKLIAEVGGYETDMIQEESRLIEDLGYDSIMAIELKALIEQRCHRPVAIRALMADLSTVGDIVGWLRQPADNPVELGVAVE